MLSLAYQAWCTYLDKIMPAYVSQNIEAMSDF